MRPEEEIGQLLKEHREARNFSIEDVVQETKIRSKYILAIESGNFSAIPGEVYLRGFIRTYAKLLELDGTMLLEKLPVSPKDQDAYATPPDQRTKTGELQTFRDELPRRRGRSSTDDSGVSLQSVIKILKVLVIIAALVFSMNYVYQNIILRNLPDPIENGGDEDPDDNGNGSEEPTDPIPAVINIVSDSTTSATVEIEAESETWVVTVKATARCWLRVQIDNNPAASQTLQPGQEAAFTAMERIEMRAGNSGGIIIYIDDQVMEVSGRSGGVKNYTITRTP